MKHSTKSYELISVKTLGPADGEPEGTFEAVWSVFDNIDKMGDRVRGKAFDDTLDDWRTRNESSGARIPVIFSHAWDDPMKFVGSADPNDVYPIPGVGMYAKGIMHDIDPQGSHYNPMAAQVHSLMKNRVLTEWSFGYNVPKGGQTKSSDGAMDLNRLNLFEFGPTLKGVNSDTATLAVKAIMEAKENVKSYVDVDVDGSFEEIQEALNDALKEKYPPPATQDGGYVYRYVTLVATTGTTAIYQICSNGDDDDTMYQCDYTIGDDGSATLGDPTEVQAKIVPKAADKPAKTKDATSDEEGNMKAEKAWELARELHPDGVPDDVMKALFADPEGWMADRKSAEATAGYMSESERTEAVKAAIELAHKNNPDGISASVTSEILDDPKAYIEAHTEKPSPLDGTEEGVLAKAWDGSASNYTDAEYAKACVLDRAIGNSDYADSTAKERYGLPIAKPGKSYVSDPDAGGVAAAATRISGTKASAEAIKTAASRLARAYGKLGKEVPDGVTELTKAEVLSFYKDVWHAEQSLETMEAENSKARSLVELSVWEQSIENAEASVGPMSADALEAQRRDREISKMIEENL